VLQTGGESFAIAAHVQSSVDQNVPNPMNLVSVIGESTLSGNVALYGATDLVIKGRSHWYPGQYSVIGSSGSASTPEWDSPVSFARLEDGDDWVRGSLTIDRNQRGQVIVADRSTLNPGGPGAFMTSNVYIGAANNVEPTHAAQLWLAGDSTLEIDIGHKNGSVINDRLLLNSQSSQKGSIMTGAASENGGYNVKVRLLGLQGVLGQELVLAQANNRIMAGKLMQPLAVTGHNYEIRAAEGGGEQMVYRLDSVKFERPEMDKSSRTIARQMDEQLAQGNYEMESSMVAALGYYGGAEGVYEEQVDELAESGTVLDVTARQIQASSLQANLHSCLEFVGDGLGLVEQNCTYARVTGSDVSLSGASGSDSD